MTRAADTGNSRQMAGRLSCSSYRALLWVAVGVLPAVVLSAWWIDWRQRMARTVVPEKQEHGFLFSDASDLAREASDLALSISERPLADRVRGAGRVATLLTLADHLEDIQTVLGFCLPRLDGMLARRSSPGDSSAPILEAGSLWVYENLGARNGRGVFLEPGAPGAAEYLHWADIRRAGFASRTAPGELPRLHQALGPDTTLSAEETLAAITIWEASLSRQAGRDPIGPLNLLSVVQVPFSGTFVYSDRRTVTPDGWALRALRYPDVNLPSDLALVLRNAIMPYADRIWLSLRAEADHSASSGTPDAMERYAAEVAEAYLRWCIARSRAANHDTHWFREHQETLGTGGTLYHHWTRVLAWEAAQVRIPEPEGAEAERAFPDGRVRDLVDALALAERHGPVEVRRRFPGDGHDLRLLLEPYVTELDQVSQVYLPIARAVAMAYASNDYVVGLWRDLAPLFDEGPILEHEQWMFLCRARIMAAQALGRLAALADRPSEDVGSISSELCLWDPQPWSLETPEHQPLVRLVQYVPGLQSLHAVIILATQGERPRIYTAS